VKTLPFKTALCVLGALTLIALSSSAQSPPASPSSSPQSPAPLQTVERVDLDRYLGQWYQIALYPNRFQAQCVRNTTASYQLESKTSLSVTNSCVDAQGKTDTAQGMARLASPGDTTKLQVSFLPSWLRWTGIGWGNYWVIQLGTQTGDDKTPYRYAVVSEPKREFLWILARTPSLSAADTAAIRTRLVEQGFDLAKLEQHPQSAR
jgi:apolipoprotein D and lipocalin family protein